jgi:hypothetical protein
MWCEASIVQAYLQPARSSLHQAECRAFHGTCNSFLAPAIMCCDSGAHQSYANLEELR